MTGEYAELAFPRTEYTTATLRRSTDPATIYAQIDHNRSGNGHHSTQQQQIPTLPQQQQQQQSPPPLQEHFIQQATMFDQHLHQQPIHHHLSPQHQAELPHIRHVSSSNIHPIGIPTIQLGTPYPTPAPPLGFGGAIYTENSSSPPPVILHEEEEQDNVETPLMNNHKESEV